MRNSLVIVAGPTAVGKSDFAVKLAKRINGEVISADSMQVYKGMDIGSAKITEEEMDGVPHHLIDILDPAKDFNVVLFKELAKNAADDILKRGKVPIIAGGTGFYIQALLYDIAFEESEGENPSYRLELEKLYKEKGPDYLFNILKSVDEKTASIIHKNDEKRVIRALEFFNETGRPISEHNEEQRKRVSDYNFAFFVLNDEREKVYDRINLRVDKMIDSGLIDEVKKFHSLGLNKYNVSMQGLGYKEILMYLEGEISLDEAVYRIKRDSRHFAKRQITWFKREKDVTWLNKYDFSYDDEKMLDFAVKYLSEKSII